MSIKKTLGGDRLGAGKKMKIELHNYERSTHDLGYIWRSTAATGTLIPFLKNVALPGDNFKIELNADVKTLPTLGPLFGSFKLQLDIFLCPIRLYNARLHMNELGIGLDMSKIKLPTVTLTGNNLDFDKENVENQQINQSSLAAYLGYRGLGQELDQNHTVRKFNALPLLMYWDIYKSYYANKQEEIGFVLTPTRSRITRFSKDTVSPTDPNNINYTIPTEGSTNMDLDTVNAGIDEIDVHILGYELPLKLDEVFIIADEQHGTGGTTQFFLIVKKEFKGKTLQKITIKNAYTSLELMEFELKNIDNVKKDILRHSLNTPYDIDEGTGLPYTATTAFDEETYESWSKYTMSGLGIKTYQSDIFNNWLNTEWIDGENGINSITAVDTSGGSFNIDTLNLAKKVYDMLNRIAVSGGSYEDWVEAVYAHEPYRRAENPIYCGGLSKEIIFQEVISTAETTNSPLATLAGKGRLSDKHKGGYIEIKVDEPSYIMGIVSITPRIDYSQGIDWDTMLETMDDFHKPALDGIGFQDLPTYHLAAWELKSRNGKIAEVKTVGKQPAWLNYMTAYNKTFGEFANINSQMFMTLNRRYEANSVGRIKDLTSYIDPQKFNYIFAETRRDAQNFWIQLAIDITARRKMSAKIMPNL